ncbi:MAG: hypothetical protein ACPG61_16670 [Paracoccaceae bacterium]
MPPINVLTAIPVAFGFFAVALAFVPFLRRSLGDISFHLIRGALGVAIVFLVRSGYWDFGQYLAGDAWASIRFSFGGQKASALFNLMMLYPIRDFLKARWFLIDVSERDGWHWWNSFTHPTWRVRRFKGD